jgi:hypothetical protein
LNPSTELQISFYRFLKQGCSPQLHLAPDLIRVRELQLSSTNIRASFACLRAVFAYSSRTRIHQGVFHYSSQNFAHASIPSRTLRSSCTRILPTRTRICHNVLAICLPIFARANFFSPSANFKPFYPLFYMFSLLIDLGLWNKLSLKNLYFPTLVAIFICKNTPIYLEKSLDLE